MDLSKIQNDIRWFFSVFANAVETASMVGAHDINHYSETLLIPLFSEIYGYTNLKNLNTKANPNHPAVDLGDEVARVAFQITSTSNSEKVKHTIQEFVDHKLYEKYDQLIIYILTRKQGSYSGRGFEEIIQDRFIFDKDADILDCRDLIRIIDDYQIDKARRILNFFKANFGDWNPSFASTSASTQPNRELENVLHINSSRSITESDLNSLSPNLRDALSVIVNEISQRSDQTLSGQLENPATAYCRTQVALARDWVQTGQVSAARKVLLRLYNESSSYPLDLRFDIVKLLGCCELELDNAVVARRYFQEALRYEPSSWKVLINDSMAALLIGDTEDALRLSTRAREIDPHNSTIVVTHAQALHKAGRADELARFLEEEPDLLEYPSGAAVLAIIRIDAGKYQEAETLLRQAITKDPDSGQLYLLLAQALTEPLRSLLAENSSDSKSVQDQLHAAEDTLTQAVALAERLDNPIRLQTALVRRAGVRRVAGKLEDALKDCDLVLAQGNGNLDALDIKGRILLDMDRWEDAARCFESVLAALSSKEAIPNQSVTVSNVERTRQVRYFLGIAYLNARHPEKVLPLLDIPPDLDSDDESLLGDFEILLGAHRLLHHDTAVADIIRRIEQIWPNNAIAKTILAEHYRRTRDFLRAADLLQEAVELTQGDAQKRLKLQLAHIRSQEGDYIAALQILRPLIDRSCDNPDLRMFILCLYNAQQFSEALQLARNLRALSGPLPTISAIEATILERGGNVEEARDIWIQLGEVEPDNVNNKLHLAFVEFRRLNVEAAKEVVLGIPYDAVKDEPELLMPLSRLRLMLDLPKVLEYAYRGLRLDYENSETHVQYITLCLDLRGPEAALGLLEPDSVAVDTSVHVRHGRDTIVFTILDDGPIHRDRGELSKDDPRARKLLGRHKGESVAFEEGFLGDQGYEIVDIQTKYLYASHRSTHLFKTGLLQHPNFKVIDVEYPTFIEHFVQFLDRQGQYASETRSLYLEKCLPLSALASLINRPLIELWFSLTESPDARIKVASGTVDEAQEQRSILVQATAVVLDLTAILTIVDNGLEDAIANRFATLVIGQSSIDELRQYEYQLSNNPPSAVMGSSQGQRFFIDLPNSYFERRLGLIRKVMEFINAHVQTVPTMAIIDLDQEVLQLLGDSSTSSCVLAKERKLPLYSDDLYLRSLAQTEWNVRGFCTQSVLLEMYERGMLTRDGYCIRLRHLAEANYSFLRLSADSLMWQLEQSSITINDDVRNMFKPLRDPDCSVHTAAIILAQVIKRVWIGRGLDHQKLFVLVFALETLTEGRRADTALDLLRTALRSEFGLLPHMLQPLFETIRAWHRTRFYRFS